MNLLFLTLLDINSIENYGLYWLNCLLIDKVAMCEQVRSDNKAMYIPEHGKSCPTEILGAIFSINDEGRPIWKPMHMQPMYRMNAFVRR